jgi:phage terminase Nu1 subunit (DNA packaging protein)
MALISKAELAKRAKCSRQTIYEAIGNGHFEAEENGKVNDSDPDVLYWLATRQNKLAPSDEAVEAAQELAEDKKTLEVLKLQAQIEEIRLKNAERTSRLVDREVVERLIFSPLERAFVRLLTDVPRSLSSKVYNEVKAGGGLESIEKLIHDEMSRALKQIRDRVKKGL